MESRFELTFESCSNKYSIDQLSKGRVEVGVARGIYGREAINLNVEADMKDQAKNFRLFEVVKTFIQA